MGFTKVSCTNLSPRRRMRCAGDLENALCRFPFCFRLNFPEAVTWNLRFHEL